MRIWAKNQFSKSINSHSGNRRMQSYGSASKHMDSRVVESEIRPDVPIKAGVNFFGIALESPLACRLPFNRMCLKMALIFICIMVSFSCAFDNRQKYSQHFERDPIVIIISVDTPFQDIVTGYPNQYDYGERFTFYEWLYDAFKMLNKFNVRIIEDKNLVSTANSRGLVAPIIQYQNGSSKRRINNLSFVEGSLDEIFRLANQVSAEKGTLCPSLHNT